MRIDSSVIGMESERTYSSVSGRVSKLTITDGRQDFAEGTGSLFGNLLQPEEEDAGQAKEKENPEDFITKTMEEMRSKQLMRTGNIRTSETEETRRHLYSIRQQCLNFLMDLLFFGRRSLQNESNESTSQSVDSGEAGIQSAIEKLVSPVSLNMRTFTFSRQYYYEETETTSYTTQGTVKCADGREINFNLNLNMSRSFQEYYEENYAVIEASMCDPLVINLDGNIAELSDQTFYFDIDGDGEKDEISRLSEGSGYLALDKNGDGVINDGTELFGTASGNGFADLAEYDSDGNGFIDEGDEIWNKLKIWTMDEEGNEQLISLSEKGVGAICLQNISTDFSLTGQDNHTKGMIRNTGFFLYENGTAGSIQHVDVARYSQAV
ncbi:MAG: hypothetical protein ACI4SD_02440 [Suilimivivens sp.]